MNKRGAILVILDEEDRLLLLKRHPSSIYMPNKWGLPGGKIEESETPMEAAIRETEEETALRVHNVKELQTDSDLAVVFFTRSYEGSVQIDFEHTDWAWVALGDLIEYDVVPNIMELFAEALTYD